MRMALILIIGTCLAIHYGPEPLPYVIGQRIESPIIARAEFTVPEVNKTQYERRKARELTPSHYVFDESRVKDLARRLDAIFHSAGLMVSVAPESATQLSDIDRKLSESLRTAAESVDPADAGAGLGKLIEELSGLYTGDRLEREPRDPPSSATFVVVHPAGAITGGGRPVPRHEIVAVDNDEAVDARAKRLASWVSEPLREPLVGFLVRWIKSNPTLRYDPERTARTMTEAEESVTTIQFVFKRGEAFIVAPENTTTWTLTDRDFELLQTHRAAVMDLLHSGAPEADALQLEWRQARAGRFLIGVLLAAGLVLYVVQHQSRLMEHRAHRWAFMGLVLLSLATSRLVIALWPQYRELVLFPNLCVAASFAMLFPRRFAIGAVVMVCLLATLVVYGNLSQFLVLSISASVFAHQLEAIRSRIRLLTAGLLTAAAAALTSMACDLMSRELFSFALHRGLWAGGCALGAAFFISGILPLIESIFRVATPLALMQWRDSAQPLLQLLARQAPGTYQHSLAVSKLAEDACQAIGADSLLASVGALYHDIGKILKPEYFTENQSAPINRHSHLAPRMSLLIILAHVKDGVELARAYKLPPALIPFIREHHGTTLVKYFHHMAAEKQPTIATGRHDRDVPEADFRYPGPKPRTRETAVLMLCDGVEGAVRALRDPTPGRIESTVHQIVVDRLGDGQFDECDITLAQIHAVEQALVKSLCSIYHGRVAYPGQRPSAAPSVVKGHGATTTAAAGR